jgi:hypothetical protein
MPAKQIPTKKRKQDPVQRLSANKANAALNKAPSKAHTAKRWLGLNRSAIPVRGEDEGTRYKTELHRIGQYAYTGKINIPRID